MSEIKKLVDQIVQDGVMTSEEYDQFLKGIYADGVVDDEESAEISRILQLVKDGKLKVVDAE